MMIRNILMAATAFSAIAGVAAAAETATAPVKANIVTPASISRVGSTELNFGTLSRTGTPAASVVIGTDGVRGATSGFAASGDTEAAEFTIAGFPGQIIDITAEITEDLGDGISVSLNAEPNATLDSSGAYTLQVGGTLSIASGTIVDQDAYDGTMTVTVAYN